MTGLPGGDVCVYMSHPFTGGPNLQQSDTVCTDHSDPGRLIGQTPSAGWGNPLSNHCHNWIRLHGVETLEERSDTTCVLGNAISGRRVGSLVSDHSNKTISTGPSGWGNMSTNKKRQTCNTQQLKKLSGGAKCITNSISCFCAHHWKNELEKCLFTFFIMLNSPQWLTGRKTPCYILTVMLK